MRWMKLAAALMTTTIAGLASCGDGKPPPKAIERPVITRDLPAVLRNLVGSETTVRGMDPALVSGYGLVVGLNGTGSRDIPAGVRAYMENEMNKLGVGRTGGPLANITASEMLDDPNTAVVLVQALVPPAAPAGTKFDLYVSALRGSSTSSLEGGLLWTTDLRRGIANPAGPATQPVAQAYGPVYTNPFARPGESAIVGGRIRGTIIGGGTVTNPLSILLALDNPSHARSRAIAAALNNRFPARDGTKTARGVDEDIVEVNVPREYHDRPEEFIQLLRYTRIDQSFPQEWARRFTDAMKESPELADEMSWALSAIGEAALPFIREMYDYSELVPRMAALQAGARLGDVLARPQLEIVATSGPPNVRTDALALMGRLKQDPKVNRFLQQMLDAKDVDVRIAAYEALVERRDPVVSRTPINDKFVLDEVPSSRPMIYVNNTKDPRIVMFGRSLTVTAPVLASAPDNSLIIKSMEISEGVSVLYRNPKTGRQEVGTSDRSLTRVIDYFSHKTTPEEPAPGLDMSFSQVVGSLYLLRQAGGLSAEFVTQDDRVALERLRRAHNRETKDRPELSADGSVESVVPPEFKLDEEDVESDPNRENRRKAYVVEMPPAPPPKK